MTFRIAGSTTLADAAFLTLEQLEVVGSDGDTFDRVAVRHPGAVAVVPIDEDGEAVLVRQYRAALDRTVLEIPAGKRDVEGEPPEETARRELVEEIEREPRTLVWLGVFWTSPGWCDEETHVFLARDLQPAATGHPLRHEEASITLEKVALDEVPDLVAARYLVDAKTIVGLLLAREHLRHG